MNKRPTFIDLFCGCGGFTLGMQRAGFECLAAIDFNSEAVTVFRANFPDISHALEQDLMAFPPKDLSALIKTSHIDVIVGGPPCQGFSTARQRDGANNGKRIVDDPRRHLYQEFLKYVKFFQPKVFVMENVLGIRSAAEGEYFSRMQKEARALGYRVHPQMENAYELGVPQKRKRQLFIGTRIDLAAYFYGPLKRASRVKHFTSLWQAVGDLPPLEAGKGIEKDSYDMGRRQSHVERFGRNFLYDVLEVHRAKELTVHCARYHSERDLRDFALLREGESSAEAMRRGVNFEFPYDKTSFKDRYTRQHRNEPCSTIVAHMSKDGLMFIHPVQNRSLTPREAARIQSFPDWFIFPIPRMHQFRVIGNAVPPLVAEAIGNAVKSYLGKISHNFSRQIPNILLPKNRVQALNRLSKILEVKNIRKFYQISSVDFKLGWFSIAYLYPSLHPVGALDNNRSLKWVENNSIDRDLYLSSLCHVESGWPVTLMPIVREAWRRYKEGDLQEGELYCDEAVALRMAGQMNSLI